LLVVNYKEKINDTSNHIAAPPKKKEAFTANFTAQKPPIMVKSSHLLVVQLSLFC